MSTLTITHTHLEGTMIEGTSRGDGSSEVLKANRWRWSRNLGAWYIRGSRDHNARTWQVDATVQGLRAAGFEVEVEIDDTPRPTAEVQEDKSARAADRAAALDAKADRLRAKSDAHQAAADQISSGIPFGQPILIGHHSEGRARRDAEKIHRNMDRSVEAANQARETEHRAAIARVGTKPENPVTTGNRLDTLRAELRKLERQQRDGYTLASGPTVIAEVSHEDITDTPRMAQLREQITYWEGVRAQQIADGQVCDTSTAKIGDYAQTRTGSWWRILRVNTKSLTLDGFFGPDRVPRHRITAIRPAPTTDTPDSPEGAGQ